MERNECLYLQRLEKVDVLKSRRFPFVRVQLLLRNYAEDVGDSLFVVAAHDGVFFVSVSIGARRICRQEYQKIENHFEIFEIEEEWNNFLGEVTIVKGKVKLNIHAAVLLKPT